MPTVVMSPYGIVIFLAFAPRKQRWEVVTCKMPACAQRVGAGVREIARRLDGAAVSADGAAVSAGGGAGAWPLYAHLRMVS